MKNKANKILLILAGILACWLVGEGIFNTFQVTPIDYGKLTYQIFVVVILGIIGRILWMYIEISNNARR